MLFTYGPNRPTRCTHQHRLDSFASLYIFTSFILYEWTIFLSSDQTVSVFGFSSAPHSNQKPFISMNWFLLNSKYLNISTIQPEIIQKKHDKKAVLRVEVSLYIKICLSKVYIKLTFNIPYNYLNVLHTN